MKKIYLLLSLSLCTGLLHAQNNALSFDGTDDYVDCGNDAALNGNTVRTMECWVKFNTFTGDQEILSKSIAGYGIEVLLYNNSLAVYCMNNTRYSFIQYPVSSLQTGVWYHVAFSWDGTRANMRLYVNGVAVGTRTDGSPIDMGGVFNTASGFRIGDWADATVRRPFKGSIDEVRIWNVQRSAAEIKAGMYGVLSSATGLVAYYRANEGSGTTLANGTFTTGVNGTLINGTSWTSSPVQYSSNALHFDGVNDQMIAPASSLLDLTTGTVECWIKPGVMNYNGCFAGNRGTTATRYSFHINTTANTIGLFNGTIYNSVSYSFAAGQWYHVAFVCNGTSTFIYVNGSLAGSVASVFNTATTGQPLVIGIAKFSGGDMEPFLGEVDEVRVWNTQRTQTELQTYKDKSLTGSETGLVALYTFNQGTASGNNAGLVTVTDLTANNNHGTMSGFVLSGTSSNFTAHAMTVLPVQLTAFTAVRNKSDVTLQWQTATEENSRSFVVERSVDGLRFTSLGTVQATGQTAQSQNYSFRDLNPQAGTVYYRLRLVDRNGAFTFSPVRTVRWNEGRALTCSADGSGNAILKLENGDNEPYSVSDVSGRVVGKGKLIQGQACITSLPAGIYVATGGNASENLQVKFMINK